MRKFRLKSDDYIVRSGEIYREDEKLRPNGYPISFYVEKYPEDWEEVFDEPKKLHKDTDLGYFAGLAMQALICNPNIKRPDDSVEENEEFSNVAIRYAQSIIKALDREVGNE